MKALITSAVLAALTLFVSGPRAWGQHPAAANATRYKIAVVDISYIFKEHAQFKRQIETMQQKMEALDKQFSERRQAIGQKEQERNQYKSGSQEWKDLDKEITRLKAEFTVEADQQQKALMQEEANMYYQTYLEVQDAIKTHAESNDIGLVLRFNGDEIDPSVREDIIRGINRPVVYQNAIDITPEILQRINRSAGTGSGGASGPGGSVSNRNATIPRRQ